MVVKLAQLVTPLLQLARPLFLWRFLKLGRDQLLVATLIISQTFQHALGLPLKAVRNAVVRATT